MGHDAYESLSRATSEGEHIRLAYDGKDLEIMVTSNLHANRKDLLGRIIAACDDVASIPCVSNGEATWETPERGLQADLSYHFDPEKIRAARQALARNSMEQGDYPSPDLVVEIDLSGPRVDRPAIYAPQGRRGLAAQPHGVHHRATPGGRFLCRGRREPVPRGPRRAYYAG